MMLSLCFSYFCLAACLLACAAAGLPAPASAQVSPPLAARSNGAASPVAIAFSKAVEHEDAAGVAQGLRADPRLASKPLATINNGVGPETVMPLALSAYYGNVPIVTLLLQAGANVNAADAFGETALYQAAECGEADTVRLLLAHGANVARKSIYGETALHGAVKAGSAATVALLLAHGADVRGRDEYKETPLSIALHPSFDSKDYPAIIQMLRRHGAK